MSREEFLLQRRQKMLRWAIGLGVVVLVRNSTLCVSPLSLLVAYRLLLTMLVFHDTGRATGAARLQVHHAAAGE